MSYIELGQSPLCPYVKGFYYPESIHLKMFSARSKAHVLFSVSFFFQHKKFFFLF
jgi:hypothetical protein